MVNVLVGAVIKQERKSHLHLKFKYEFMVYIRKIYRRKELVRNYIKEPKNFSTSEDKEIKSLYDHNYNSEFFEKKVRKGLTKNTLCIRVI
jgi:hypothetical protein